VHGERGSEEGERKRALSLSKAADIFHDLLFSSWLPFFPTRRFSPPSISSLSFLYHLYTRFHRFPFTAFSLLLRADIAALSYKKQTNKTERHQ
jgi:hypothetical protein